MPSLTTVIASGVSGLLFLPLLAFAAPGSGTACASAAAITPPPSAPASPSTGAATTVTSTAGNSTTADPSAGEMVWDGEQTANAALIVSTGQTRGVPVWGWIIAVATAMQESRLRNLRSGDRDSIGLFQQRPSQGWGTATQLRSPAYQVGKFYDALLAVPGWQTMPVAQASDRVQRSAFPDAYARWTRPAVELVTRLTARRAPGPSAGPGTAGCLAGQQVLARAATWLTAWRGGPVPYSMSTDPASSFQGYRRDCSGYASMALGLPGPGLDTAGLAASSTPIQKSDLAPGDLLINPAPGGAGHVVVFQAWADSAMSAYLGYEQSADGGTHYRRIPYPYFGQFLLSPYRV